MPGRVNSMIISTSLKFSDGLVNKEPSEPEPEQMISCSFKSPRNNATNIESCIYRSSIHAANLELARPIPKFLKESYANRGMRPAKLGTPKRNENYRDPKKMSGFFRLSNIFAKNQQNEEDPRSLELQETSEIGGSEIFQDLSPGLKFNLGIVGNPLYPLAISEDAFNEVKEAKDPLGNHEDDEEEEEVSTIIDSDRDSDVSDHKSIEHSEDEENALERSFEVPVSDFAPVFTEDESLEQILSFLQVYLL